MGDVRRVLDGPGRRRPDRTWQGVHRARVVSVSGSTCRVTVEAYSGDRALTATIPPHVAHAHTHDGESIVSRSPQPGDRVYVAASGGDLRDLVVIG